MVKRRKDCGLRALVSRSLFHPGSEVGGSAELRKREHENKTGGNWEEKEPGRLSLPSFLLPPPPPRHLFACLLLSRLPHFLRPGLGYVSRGFAAHLSCMLSSQFTKVCAQRENVISHGVSDILPPLPSVWLYSRQLSCYTVSSVLLL